MKHRAGDSVGVFSHGRHMKAQMDCHIMREAGALGTTVALPVFSETLLITALDQLASVA